MALVKAEEASAGLTGLGGLNALRQIGLMIGLAASVAIGVTVVLWSWAPNYGVLYGALEKQDVGTVLDALRTNGINAKLDENTGAILVPVGEIHDARIKLASMGLPKGVSAGFDALDEKSNFGVSQFMEKARYHRALEIELARTVTHLSSVKNARIHLAIPRQSVFVRNRRKASASVMANLFPGRQLEPAQVAAIVHMVASSVPNLETSQVTVVDQKGKLLTPDASDRQMAMSSAQFEYTRHLENNLTRRIERILEPMLGANAVRAQVTADVDFTVTEQTQESFNPDTPVLRSAQTTEEKTISGIEGGIPGALSNQPPGVATAPETVGEGADGVTAAAPTRSHIRKIQNYELDKTISHTRYAAGRLHRLSVAVVVDDRVIMDDSGKISRMSRTPEQLERLTGLVKEAVGFNTQRGDSVNVMNASFILPTAPEALPEIPIWEQAWIQDMLKKLLGASLVLLLFFGVLKPVMKSLAQPSTAMLPAAAEGAAAGEALAEDTVSLTGETPIQALDGPDGYGQNMAMATKVVEQDPKLVAQVVKNWVAADG